MKSYFASRISDNISMTPEGYLICHDVPIARIGTQDYYGYELGLDDKKLANLIFTVERPADEVFSKATLASFEGKSFTNDHPPSNTIDSQNTFIYEKGHGQNVRKSDDNEHIICDIFIKEAQIIKDVQSGRKREISAGYTCDLVPTDNGFKQTNIRGNHIALVEKGRAGSEVCIKDKEKERKFSMKTPEEKKGFIGLALKKFFADAEPEEVVDSLGIVEGKDETQKINDKEELEKRLTAIENAVKTLDEKITQRFTQDEEPEKTALDELEKEVKHETNDEDPKIIEPNDEEPPKTEACDKAILNDIREAKKIIGQIKDEKQRMAVADSMAALIRGKASGNTYAKILKTTKKVVDNEPKVINYAEAYETIKQNHFRK